jgi:hypothetical protein
MMHGVDINLYKTCTLNCQPLQLIRTHQFCHVWKDRVTGGHAHKNIKFIRDVNVWELESVDSLLLFCTPIFQPTRVLTE